jgi:hypothetical protein
MPKDSDGTIAIVALIALAAWLLIGLPLLYLPDQGHVHGEFLGVKYGEWLLFLATVALAVTTWLLVKGAERTAERQLRAYVHVADAQILHDNDEWQPNIRITIKNYGQTPARRVNHKASTELAIIGPGSFELKDEPHFSDLGPTQEITKSIVVSHGFWYKTVKPSVASKAVKYYVFGKITYSDIFSASVRTTEYRLQLDVDDAGANMLITRSRARHGEIVIRTPHLPSA